MISQKINTTVTSQGFKSLYSFISSNSQDVSLVRIGLESTGHYGIALENFLNKKISEGKHYFVANSHTAKKLLRVIYHLLKKNIKFIPQV